MVKFTSNKLAGGLIAAVAGAAALSVAAPAEAYVRGHWGGGGHWGGHVGGHYWGGPRVSIGLGIGSCCWGPAWSGYYYPYYYPYPYVARPARFYDDDYAYGFERNSISIDSPWVREALDAPIGDAIQWDDGAIHGSVTTTRDGWSGNRYCREFRQSVTIDGRARDAYGTACRTADDKGWQLVQNQR
jgi:hypothetical protein